MSSDKPPAPIPTSLTLESQPNLLGIPLEIRHLIYDYVFKDVVIAESHSICDPQSHRGAYEFPNGSPYGLLWVNQQIRDEASSFAHVYPIHYIVPRCSSERRYPMLPLEVQQQISEIHAIATPNAVFRMRRLRSMINDPGLFGLTRVDCHHDTLRYDVSLTRFSEIAALIDQALDAIPFPQGRQGRFSRMRRLPTLQNTPHAYGHPSRSGYVSLRVPITFPAVIALRRSDLKTQDRDSGTLSHLRHEYLASVTLVQDKNGCTATEIVDLRSADVKDFSASLHSRSNSSQIPLGTRHLCQNAMVLGYQWQGTPNVCRR